GGVGLLNNYGLLSTVVGNAISLYALKKYYDGVCSIRTSKAVVNADFIEPSLSTLTAMIEMQGRYWLVMRRLMYFGALAWLVNVGFHLFDNPEVWWGHKVFDSIDHPLTFTASRFHNLYTWLLIMQF